MSLSDVVIIKVADAASSAGTAVNGITVDTADCEGVIFCSAIATANAGNFLKLQEGDTTSPTADVEGSAVVAGSNGDQVQIDFRKPLKRYVRAVIVRAGANTATSDIWAIKYGVRKKATTNSGVSETITSPIAGTP